MSLFRRTRPAELNRQAAMSARPRQAPIVRTEERPDGGANVTVLIRRPVWQRWIGGSHVAERTFGLDAYGREVFEACDGKRSVQAIVRRFARQHKLSRAEAEMSVTTFVRTLLGRGLLVIEVDRPDGKRER